MSHGKVTSIFNPKNTFGRFDILGLIYRSSQLTGDGI